MIAARAILFNILFYLNLILFLVLGSPFFLTPRRWSMAALKVWARTSLWLLRVVCRITMEVRGLEHIPAGPALIAGKHQSLWETFAILPLLADPCMVLKRELTFIPFFGWFIFKFKMIAVARGAGSAALRDLIKQGKLAAKAGRQIVILPEGTRRAPGAPPDYKPGAAALYTSLNLPCVPFGLNAGVYWPRRQWQRYPGRIILQFAPAIPPGLPRREFAAKLQDVIESISTDLLAETKS
jgi:1-acyl-sn-glycerol-3-phosphate acyltransferase